ncbi:hypothetical protein GCM10022204_21660 [Microlunatus aurantiacus]|uniref:DUF2510 domain-containing protein n=1 Tax=Microlunatus aurantiacus TaxID=446786 RepID=A0ABP7DCY1_9ACTN
MSAPPGWYPDPAGAPGRFRFWDGQRWGAATTDRPDARFPPESAPHVQPIQRPSVPPSAHPGGTAAGTAPGAQPVGAPRRRPWGWWLAAGVVLLAVAVVAVLVVRSVAGSVGPGPVEDPGQDSCPRATAVSSPAAPSTGDRVRSGLLSYPRLAEPFKAPGDDDRTPFGHDVQSQQAFVERSADGQTEWVAWALIARLLAGDGFYGPEQGAGVVADCVVALFYDDHEIKRTDTRRAAITVDGHEAYVIESHLTFDIPGIKAKGETMIVVVVDVGTGEAGLFYGTIPDNAPQFLPPIRRAMADLRVS